MVPSAAWQHNDTYFWNIPVSIYLEKIEQVISYLTIGASWKISTSPRIWTRLPGWINPAVSQSELLPNIAAKQIWMAAVTPSPSPIISMNSASMIFIGGK